MKKRVLIFFLAIGITAVSSVSMAAMSNSRIRKETRFLTDKMRSEERRVGQECSPHLV